MVRIIKSENLEYNDEKIRTMFVETVETEIKCTGELIISRNCFYRDVLMANEKFSAKIF